jgi:hypothetical protein
MTRIKLNPMDLTVDTFETGMPGARPLTAPHAGVEAAAPTPGASTIFTNPQTNEQICFCMTWVAEDCIGPTAGCSTSDGSAV